MTLAIAGPNRPGEIANLVREVLSGMSRTSDLTDRVFLRIKADPRWSATYDDIVARRGMGPVNKAIGRSVKDQMNAQSGSREHQPQSKLIQTYTRLYWP
ncbi:MAG: hypothetical protein OXT72_14930 [Gammaproteobacteria bacterium]|nr:hypothetical protein [Gammaproteobacteria bacterium]MDE0248410.1 hypothetical protein [Gammaproteobacteria bacterium]